MRRTSFEGAGWVRSQTKKGDARSRHLGRAPGMARRAGAARSGMPIRATPAAIGLGSGSAPISSSWTMGCSGIWRYRVIVVNSAPEESVCEVIGC
jgi:hypothetical protein